MTALTLSFGARRRRRKRRRKILSIITGAFLTVAGVCDVREESLTPPTHEPATVEILRLAPDDNVGVKNDRTLLAKY